MNKDGKLTDVHGTLLVVGNRVKLVEGFECCAGERHGIGTVMVVHESGDWTGYVSVRWREGGRSCSVPDKALKIVAKRAYVVDPQELLAFAIFLRDRGHAVMTADNGAVAALVAKYVEKRQAVEDEEPDREPSVAQERAWNEMYP